MKIETREHGQQLMVVAEGEIDLYSSPLLRKAILDAVASSMGGVCVHLADVSYMDSSGIATLVEGLRSARTKKIAFSLLQPSQPVVKVMELARLDAIFTIETDPAG